MLCSCEEVYNGTTKHRVRARISEHSLYCRLAQPEILSSVSDYYPRLRREYLYYKHGSAAMNQGCEDVRLMTFPWFTCSELPEGAPAMWSGPEPVSYTHLDVYKRQILHCTLSKIVEDTNQHIN